MEYAVFGLQRKPWKVFRRMNQTVGWKHPKYNRLTAVEVLDFFEKKFNRLHPLERVCSNQDWKKRLLYKAMRHLGFYGNITSPHYRYYIPHGEEEEEENRQQAPTTFSQELTQDVPY